MNVATIKYYDIADGEGVRTALFVSGCRRHCKGCHNKEAWDFNYGYPFTIDIENKIIESLKPSYISGLSILGGEPYEPENEIVLCSFLPKITKSIWIYTGYKYDEIKDRELTKYASTIVDGEYIEDLKDVSLAFRGSKNQNIIRLK